jgi:hypothetical protein
MYPSARHHRAFSLKSITEKPDVKDVRLPTLMLFDERISCALNFGPGMQKLRMSPPNTPSVRVKSRKDSLTYKRPVQHGRGLSQIVISFSSGLNPSDVDIENNWELLRLSRRSRQNRYFLNRKMYKSWLHMGTVQPWYKHTVGSRIRMLIREVCLCKRNWLF